MRDRDLDSASHAEIVRCEVNFLGAGKADGQYVDVGRRKTAGKRVVNGWTAFAVVMSEDNAVR